jgi:hypothetical protein
VINQDLATHFTGPFTNRAKEVFSDLFLVGDDPVMPPAIAGLDPRDQHNIDQMSFPKNVEPGILNGVSQFCANAFPLRFRLVEDRLLLDDRTVAVTNEILQVEVPGLPGNNTSRWMQLRQSPPDVITNEVVRFVECVFNEILYAQVESQCPSGFDHKRHKYLCASCMA